MERQTFKTKINAPREKVWETLWDEKTYSQWTSAFSPTSRAENQSGNIETDWKEGSKVFFLDGSGNGMISIIAKRDFPEHLSLEHIGIIKDGKEIAEGEEVEKWAPAYENYTLKVSGGKTELIVDMDVDDEHKEYFMETWPKAFEKLKTLATTGE